MLTTLRHCLRLLPRRLRRWWLLVPLMAALTGVAEGAMAAAVFGLVSIIGDPTAVTRLPVAAQIAPLLPWQDARSQVLCFTALVALATVGKNLLLAALQYLRHKISGESSAELANRLLRAYLLAPYPLHLRRSSAQLMRNVTTAVHAVFEALAAFAATLSELLVGVGLLAVLLFSAPRVTLVTGLVLLLLGAGLLRATRRMAARLGRRTHELARSQLQTLQHAFGGIKAIKALGREEFFAHEFAARQETAVALGYQRATLQTLPPLVFETVFVCGALLVIALTTLSGHVGADGLPLLGLFAYAGFRLVPIANRVTWHLSQIRTAAAPVEELAADAALLDASTAAAGDHGPPPALRTQLALERVTYTYPGAMAPALRDASLCIARGEALGIVGPTGAGKSTLVDLIVGLLQPSSGEVTVDAVPLRGRERAWCRQVGYVPQTVFLIDDSMRRNVALGIVDAEIDDRRVRDALRAAQLDRLVAGLPHGLDARLGEHGTRLSGGERQRIGIARALYHGPELLVFDEATSALDLATEAELIRAVAALHGERTILVVAHRTSAVAHCDRLVFVRDGQVVETTAAEAL
ncbi:MAG: ABC transporter ATP-binding protein [Candidatus Binatia bacterium]